MPLWIKAVKRSVLTRLGFEQPFGLVMRQVTALAMPRVWKQASKRVAGSWIY